MNCNDLAANLSLLNALPNVVQVDATLGTTFGDVFCSLEDSKLDSFEVHAPQCRLDGPLSLTVGGYSNLGLGQWYYKDEKKVGRTNNEDTIGGLIRRVQKQGPVEFALSLVCDGMGGAASGEVASKLAVFSLLEFFLLLQPGEVEKNGGLLLEMAIQEASRRIFEATLGKPRLHGMGTTVAAVLTTSRDVHVAHVGDSRVYRYGRKESGDIGVEQITRDHSTLNALLDAPGDYTEAELRARVPKNLIARALGVAKNADEAGGVKVDRKKYESRPGDVWLLASDAVSEVPETPEKIEFLYPEELDESSVDMTGNVAGHFWLPQDRVFIDRGMESSMSTHLMDTLMEMARSLPAEKVLVVKRGTYQAQGIERSLQLRSPLMASQGVVEQSLLCQSKDNSSAVVVKIVGT